MKMEPNRLIEQQPSGVEYELLAAGKRDRMPNESRRAIFMGLGLPFVPMALDASTTAAAGGNGAEGTIEPSLVEAPSGLAPGSEGAASSPIANPGAEQVGLQQAGFGALPKPVLLSKSFLVSKSFLGLVGAGAIGAALWAGQGSAPDEVNPAPVASQVVTESEQEPETMSEPPNVDQAAELEPAEEADLADEADVESVEEPKDSETERQPARRAGPSSSKSAGGLSQELVLIEGARNALRTGNPRLALRRLNDYRSQFGKGRLRAEETMLRIEALSASGDRAGATKLGKAVLARSPNGPYSRRIRSLLGETAD